MICISGVPGSGKTTICSLLVSKGMDCRSANRVAEDLDCISNGAVDIDKMRSRMPQVDVLEGHYAHLLGCEAVIILTAREDIIRERLSARGYLNEKIETNIDSLLADTIYYESLDLLPSGKIFRVDTSDISPEQAANLVTQTIRNLRINNKS
ncbi:MAG: AAA family ATPase [Thermoplasmataceae archaeon]